ncbi:MAG TPA: decaprenyl-phosphate phosphoribosyltransferase, partial [Gaiellaceae bacterium]|nr:decaprenyl-phosphate phosphoribosyltransferase [Gaiellaceae bacterium]
MTGKGMRPLDVEHDAASPRAPKGIRAEQPDHRASADLREAAEATPRVAVRTQRALPVALLLAMRPRQWIKNLLVFAAPGAAGLLGRAVVAEKTAGAAGLFLLAAAGTYLVNDAIDAPSDRVHPDKRHRPVASGDLSGTLAINVGSALLLSAVVGAGFLAGLQLASVLGAYVVTSVTYTLWLKRVAVVELACVSAGFVLRAVAGGAAVHIPISPWFGIVTSSAALLVVAGKRSAEIDVLGRAGALHRQVLDQYSTSFLRSVRLIAAAVAIVSFCLWAFARAAHIDPSRADSDNVLFQLSIVPFVLGILSVELAIESGEGGAP